MQRNPTGTTEQGSIQLIREPQAPHAGGGNLDGDLLDELLAQLRADARDARETADRATRRAVASEELILILLDGLPTTTKDRPA
jgi:hypothetical protein